MKMFFMILSMFLAISEVEAKYNRSDWKHWSASGVRCRNTRSQLMVTQSKVPVEFTNAKKCTVKSGQWDDFYYNETITIAKDADIDHVVPLKHANDIGGESWSAEKKEQFANDPDNLIITNKTYNRQKGAKTIAQWLPVNRQYACRYVDRWYHVKKKYGLPVSKEEENTKNLLKCK